MFEQPQQSVQGQTSQPNPQTQTPQNPLDTNLQGAVDQQTLESSSSIIQIPSSSQSNDNQQVGVVQSTTDTTVSPDQHYGTSLLIGSFVLAITLLLLLARVAVVSSDNQDSSRETDL